MREFYGSYLSTLLGYDEINVLDGQDRPIFGYADGQPDNGASFERDRAAFADLVALLRQPEPGMQVAVSHVDLGNGRSLEHRAVSDIRLVNGRPCNVVIETILPDSDPGEGIAIPRRPALLVATYRLDTVFLSELGGRSGYDGLRWFAPGEQVEGQAFAVLQDTRGEVVGTLTWHADLPGEALLRKMSNGFIFALGLLVALGATGVAAVRRQTQALAEGRQREASLARTDFLTALPNRLALSETVPAMIAAATEGRFVGIVSIDLDGFKDINDSLGHQAGDAALVAVAERMAGAFPDAFVTRTGGDEFVMAVACDNPAAVAAAAEKAVRILGTPFVLPDGLNAGLGASVGYAVAPVDGNELNDLLRRSDLALFKAKRGGKGRAVAFDAAMEAAVIRRRTLEVALRRAVARDEVGVAYQPIYADDGTTVLGVEALARWDDPGLGTVPPVEFIPIAEETGLIVRLGEQVLRKAVAYASGFDQLSVAVNVSAQQIHNADVVATVAAVLAESGLPPHRLEIELTEVDPHRRRGAGGRADQGVAGARRESGAGRFRHRLFEPALFAPLRLRQAQDRSAVRPGFREGRRGPDPGEPDHRHEPRARPRRHRRGGRERDAARLPARCRLRPAAGLSLLASPHGSQADADDGRCGGRAGGGLRAPPSSTCEPLRRTTGGRWV